MKFYQFIRTYAGYGLVYVSYKASLYILGKLFSMVDEIIDNEPNASNNTNVLLNSNDGAIETYKEQVRGGNGDIILRGETVLSNALKHVKKFGDKSISAIIKPIAYAIGYLLLKFPALKGIYGAFKNAKLIIASALALTTVRIIARFDYWALIICGALPKTDIGDKTILVGLRRMRMGISNINICMPRAEDIINFVTDQNIDVKRKNDKLIEVFTVYEYLPETHAFKNPYFACIVHILITLFVINKLSFKLAIKILYRMWKTGQISHATYLEILSQLLTAGIEVDI